MTNRLESNLKFAHGEFSGLMIKMHLPKLKWQYKTNLFSIIFWGFGFICCFLQTESLIKWQFIIWFCFSSKVLWLFSLINQSFGIYLTIKKNVWCTYTSGYNFQRLIISNINHNIKWFRSKLTASNSFWFCLQSWGGRGL
jgi:hypothetical protein